MLYEGFCGPSNPSQSVIADCERVINWMPERVESSAAPTGMALYPTPGQQAFGTVDEADGRAFWSGAGRAFAVVGGGLFELFSDGTWTKRGLVTEDAFPATISYNGIAGGQLFITSGTNGYCYTLATNVLTTELTGEATQGGMINARFVAFNKTNGKVRMSALNDGTTWDPNLYFQRTQAADRWQTMVVSPPYIWLIGEETGEIWYDAGNFPQPFAPVSGATFEYGCAATFAAGVVGGAVTWLARSQRGMGQIVAAKGFNPQPISNFAVDTAVAGYNRASGVTDAELLSYEDSGHLYAAFSFPSGPGTWVYDFSTGLWHERASYVVLGGGSDIWNARVHGFAFNKHLVIGRNSGVVAELDTTFGSETNGVPIRRVRVPPPLWARAGQRIVVARLEVMAETGLGIPIGQDSDPKIMARFSTNGKTWGYERMACAGKMGDFNRRAYFLACGSSDRIWVPEIVCTDPIPWRISGAQIEGSGFQQLARGAA